MGNNEKNNAKNNGNNADWSAISSGGRGKQGVDRRRQGVIDIAGISPNGFVLGFVYLTSKTSPSHAPRNGESGPALGYPDKP
jgi:hypothetical protein